MIGYKATDMNGCCRGFKFEVGKTYTKDTPADELKCCTDKVFHFCRELCAIEKESDYKLSESRLFEVIAGDWVRSGDKYGTNSLTILREIIGLEKEALCNSGSHNSGSRNSGDGNSGDSNSGSHNSGSWNSGDGNSGDSNRGSHNSGSWNSGYGNSGSHNSGSHNSGSHNSGSHNSGLHNSGSWNSGSHNSGSWNSGSWNSGDSNSDYGNSGSHNSGSWNSGSWNSGSWNSGSHNSGSHNSGSHNSGSHNSGSWNSGSWNSGDSNSGYFNTNTPTVRMFNGDTLYHVEDIDFPSFLYFDLTVWVSHDTATEEEKKEHKKEIETCGGFLKTLEYKEAFRLAWDRANKEDHKKLLSLPNWNNEIFKEISGIDAEAEIKKEEESNK